MKCWLAFAFANSKNNFSFGQMSKQIVSIFRWRLSYLYALPTKRDYSPLGSSALIDSQLVPHWLIVNSYPNQWLLIGSLFDKKMIFNNQLRVTKKQKSFDKFCLQSASTFDRELYVSNQSALMISSRLSSIASLAFFPLQNWIRDYSDLWWCYSCSSTNNSIKLKMCACTENWHFSHWLRPSTSLFVRGSLLSNNSWTFDISER